MKFTLLLVMGMFFVTSVYAQPVTPPYPYSDDFDQEGTVTLNVAPYVNFQVMEPDVALNFDFFTPANNSQHGDVISNLHVNANVNWEFEVAPKFPATTMMLDASSSPSIIPIGAIKCSIDDNGNSPIALGVVNKLKNTDSSTGSGFNRHWWLWWDIDETILNGLDPANGAYTTEVLFTITQVP